MTASLKIDDLANHSQYMEPLSKWYHQEFLHLTDPLTLDLRQTNLQQHTKDQPLPTSFVAIKHKQLLGGLCLLEHDLETHRNFTPWLSRIFVHPKARGQSVATSLINHAVIYIKDLGHENLYLLTEQKQLFFSRIGFKEIDKTSLNGFPLSIMVLNLKEK